MSSATDDATTTDTRLAVLREAIEALIGAVDYLAGPPPVIAQEPGKRLAQIAAADARRVLRHLD